MTPLFSPPKSHKFTQNYQKSLIEFFTPSIELNFETSELRMPLRINKIGEKLYTLQLMRADWKW
jgi:hypothetical protein